jgi:hypothetical protein
VVLTEDKDASEVVLGAQGGSVHLTTIKNTLQRGLLVAAIMVPVVLVFYSLGDAQAVEGILPIPCGQDIDAMINKDDRGTATRFVLGAGCTFTASAMIVPSDGDEVVCAEPPTFRELRPPASDPNSVFDPDPAFDPMTSCAVAGPGVENVFRPIGQGGTTVTVRFEGIKITGGKYTGSTGSGAGIAEGSMTNLSSHYGIEVMNNEAAGILSAKGPSTESKSPTIPRTQTLWASSVRA